MIEDAQLLFSDAQAVTATANSTNVIDLLVARNINRNRELRWFVSCLSAAAAAGAATVTVSLVQADTADLATNPTVLYTSPVIPKATLVAGYRLVDVVVPTISPGQRYMGLVYTIATGPLTAGTFTSGFVLDTDGETYYPQFAGAKSAFTS